MLKSPCVYILKPSFSYKTYIGSTVDFEKRFTRHINELEKGIHHNILFQEEWNKNQIKEINVSVINTNSLEEAKILENILINKLIRTGNIFNIINASIGGDSLTFHPNRKNIIEKSRLSNIERNSKLSSEERIKLYARPGIKNGMFGKTHSDEVKAILSAKSKGRISANKGITFKESTRKLMSENAKLRIGKLNSFFGKKHSDEYKTCASLLKKGIPNLACSKAINIDGTNYQSVHQAGKILNIKPITLRHRIISKNKKFTNYNYIN